MTSRYQYHRSPPPSLQGLFRGLGHTLPTTYQFSGLQMVPEASMRWKV